MTTVIEWFITEFNRIFIYVGFSVSGDCASDRWQWPSGSTYDSPSPHAYLSDISTSEKSQDATSKIGSRAECSMDNNLTMKADVRTNQ